MDAEGVTLSDAHIARAAVAGKWSPAIVFPEPIPRDLTLRGLWLEGGAGGPGFPVFVEPQ